jgi:hypothetical protein
MKKIKTYIIKFITTAISVVYILMPIHKEVKSTLHFISHSIEKSGFMLSHNHNQYLADDFKNSVVSHHEHEMIDILDYFIDEEHNNEDSKKPNTINNKVDKHFHSSKYMEQKLVSTKTSSVNYNYNEKIKDGFYAKIKIPPKATKIQLSLRIT